MRKKIIISLLLSMFMIFCLTAKENKTLVLTSYEKSYDNDISTIVLRTAYRKLRINIITEYYPSLRSLEMSNNGDSDGEIHRIKGIEEKYPNLIRIKVPVQKIEIYAFSKNRNLKISTWDDLSNFNTSYTRGIILFEQKLGKYGFTTPNNQDELFNLLEKDRYEIVISTLIGGIFTIKTYGYKDIFPVCRIDVLDIYHYLNKKHANLVPKIEKVLQKMENTGEIRKIADNYIKNIPNE